MIPKFRGKTIDGSWAFGSLVKFDKSTFFIVKEINRPTTFNYTEIFRCNSCYVESSSVSLSTGLKDKNGVESWEGNYLIKEGCWPFFIKWIENEGCLMAVPVNSVQRINWNPVPVKKLLEMDYANDGNIYENPELLEGTE